MACLKAWKRWSAQLQPKRLPHLIPSTGVCVLSASICPHFFMANSYSSDRLGCTCKLNGECHCCTPRKSAPRRGSLADSHLSPTEPPLHPHRIPSPQAPSQIQHEHIRERIQNYRVIVPRVPELPGPSHDPNLPIPHGHLPRHDNMFNPYPNRLYDRSRSPSQFLPPSLPDGSDQHGTSNFAFPMDGLSDRSFTFPDDWSQRYAPSQSAFQRLFPTAPSSCGCGDGCGCPGCVHHAGNDVTPSLAAHSTCTNPAGCGTCLDCTIMSMPPIDNTAISIYDNPEGQLSIDEWIRQVSATTPLTPSPENTGHAWGDSDMSLSSQIPDFIGSDQNMNMCEGHCICPPGQCQCRSVDGSSCAHHTFSFPVLNDKGGIWSTGRSTESSRTTTSIATPDGLDRLSPAPQGFGNLFFDPTNAGGFYLGPEEEERHLSRSSLPMVPSMQDDLAGAHKPGGSGIPLSRHSTITQHRVQSTPNLMIRSNVRPESTCCSASTSSSSRSSYAHSNADSDISLERTHSPYDPSFEGMHLY
ncbi:hypothetical protein BDN72DRAFT_838074 [Pluteus cervinus]|uniref:Uncharacterized protein n=1 Tax=Pluteus cervinus TaxID=181527 RepID=A0ACD3AYT6_9AGAR|nr:hypothetical protein BDN72DRAFT_838074 [Pluteus cervinus]